MRWSVDVLSHRRNPLRPPRRTWLGLAATALLLLAATLPRAEAAPAEDGFSLERALAHVRAVADRPHPTGSAADEEVRQYLVRVLEGLGLAPELQSVEVAKDWGSVSASGLGMVFSA